MLKILGFILISTQLWSFDHGHQVLDKILKAHVTESKHSSTFDYKALKKDKTNLDIYLNSLSAVKRSEYDKFSEDQKLAFLINAYNAFTLKFVVDYYPVDSIKDIKSGFLPSAVNDPWKKLFFKLLDKEISLSELEHGLIRKDFKEPRIHFAINCASIGCPALEDEAFQATKLEKQLKVATERFLTDRSRNYFDEDKNRIHLSPIFNWFRKDFRDRYGKIQFFVLPYLLSDFEKVKKLRDKKLKINYTKYDWDLNDKTN